jgi:hypothetical protein
MRPPRSRISRLLNSSNDLDLGDVALVDSNDRSDLRSRMPCGRRIDPTAGGRSCRRYRPPPPVSVGSCQTDCEWSPPRSCRPVRGSLAKATFRSRQGEAAAAAGESTMLPPSGGAGLQRPAPHRLNVQRAGGCQGGSRPSLAAGTSVPAPVLGRPGRFRSPAPRSPPRRCC